MIKTILICDQCGKEQNGQTADGWIDVKPAGYCVATYSTTFSSPDICGLYCSVGCLSEKIAAKTAEVEDFAKRGATEWSKAEWLGFAKGLAYRSY